MLLRVAVLRGHEGRSSDFCFASVKTFGLTGGIGMGKSTVADLLRKRGFSVSDTDVIARRVVEPGRPALAEIEQLFGKEMVAKDGRLRREELAKRVFNDTEARRKLEEILHPRIRAVWEGQLRSWRVEGCPAAIVVIPLLFETGAAGDFDATICVACSAKTQRQRLLARGWSDEQIDQRLAAQFSAEKKMSLADYVVWTEGPLEVLETQLNRIIVETLNRHESTRHEPQV
jgi:dephospho-CoA kinase